MKHVIVIGSGWGAHAARATAAHESASLVAIVARGLVRSRALAATLRVPLVADIAAALRRGPVNLAVVAVSEWDNCRLASDLLNEGVDLLVSHPVAHDAAAVADLDRQARLLGRDVRVDYGWRLRPEVRALVSATRSDVPLRLAVTAPARFLPIVIDLIVLLAGPVAELSVGGGYPGALSDRKLAAPAAFAPSLLLAHRGGTVTSFTPIPHAPIGAPVEIVVSSERGRTTARLPAGGAQALAVARGGRMHEATLVETTSAMDAAAHGEAQLALVAAFIQGHREGLTTLTEEVHHRAIWTTLWRAQTMGGDTLQRLEVP